MSVFQGQSHHTYFVYGANMHPEQIARRCGSPERVGVARVAGHRLAFFGHTSVWDGGEEAAEPCEGEEVWGVLYRLPFEQADRLDDWQGVRADGTGAYFLFPVLAEDVHGVNHAALLYRKDVCGAPALPSDGQRDFIVAAAQAQGMPDGYLAYLKSLEVTKARYPVPKLEGREHWFSALRCRSCG